MPIPSGQKPFHWGTAVGLSLGAFALLMAGFLVWALRETPELSSASAYQDGLNYSAQQARLEAGRRNPIVVSEEPPILRFRGTAGARGILIFHRPDGKHSDMSADFRLDSTGHYRIHTHGLPPGRWLLQLSYRVDTTDCYAEYPLRR